MPRNNRNQPWSGSSPAKPKTKTTTSAGGGFTSAEPIRPPVNSNPRNQWDALAKSNQAEKANRAATSIMNATEGRSGTNTIGGGLAGDITGTPGTGGGGAWWVPGRAPSSAVFGDPARNTGPGFQFQPTDTAQTEHWGYGLGFGDDTPDYFMPEDPTAAGSSLGVGGVGGTGVQASGDYYYGSGGGGYYYGGGSGGGGGYSGGGGGGGGGGNAGAETTPLDPATFTGWANGISAVQMDERLNDPSLILWQVLDQEYGIDPMQNQTLYREMLPYASDAALLSLLSAAGSGPDVAAFGKNTNYNLIGDYLDAALTPGGGTASWDAGVNTILSTLNRVLAADGTVANKDALGPLGSYLVTAYTDGAGQNVTGTYFDAVGGLLNALARQSLGPLAAAGVSSQMGMLEKQYNMQDPADREPVARYVMRQLGY